MKLYERYDCVQRVLRRFKGELDTVYTPSRFAPVEKVKEYNSTGVIICGQGSEGASKQARQLHLQSNEANSK